MSMQTKRVVEDVVLASEIMQLAEREGYCKCATRPGWSKVRFPFVCYPVRVPAFIDGSSRSPGAV